MLLSLPFQGLELLRERPETDALTVTLLLSKTLTKADGREGVSTGMALAPGERDGRR